MKKEEIELDFEGRVPVFKSLVGSHNYNLNTAESDKDYKLFVLPKFDDLYNNFSFAKSYIGETEDYDVHAIRKCSSLWYKANVNFLEVLFSNNLEINENLSEKSKKIILELISMRDSIATMHLSYLYAACIGMYKTKTKYLYKGTEGTKNLVLKYGYDTKQAMHSIRILDFLRRFYNNEFTDFKEAIYYKNDDPIRKFLLDIKVGKYLLNDFHEMSQRILEDTEKRYKDKYDSFKLDKATNNKIVELIKELVKINI